MSNQSLNAAQVEIVRAFFQALAFFRKENYRNPDDEFLSRLTVTYCRIMTIGGGNPIKLAASMVLGRNAVDLEIPP